LTSEVRNEAHQHLSGKDQFVQAYYRGRGGKPVARLTRIKTPKRPIRFGLLKGK
jgi:hypothetical protein